MKEIYTGTVTRYCKPSSLKAGNPSAWSFRLRDGEDFLSVYLLDYFNALSEKEGIIKVKNKKLGEGFKFNANGIFCTLDIEQSEKYIFDFISEKISYQELNLPHCGIFHESNDLLVSELLSQCVKNTYPVNDV